MVMTWQSDDNQMTIRWPLRASQVLRNSPVETLWESSCVEVRPHGASMGHGLLNLLAADAAARDGSRGAADADAGAAPAASAPFDFALCIGKFTTRDPAMLTPRNFSPTAQVTSPRATRRCSV